jgi:hypothetical protein
VFKYILICGGNLHSMLDCNVVIPLELFRFEAGTAKSFRCLSANSCPCVEIEDFVGDSFFKFILYSLVENPLPSDSIVTIENNGSLHDTDFVVVEVEYSSRVETEDEVDSRDPSESELPANGELSFDIFTCLSLCFAVGEIRIKIQEDFSAMLEAHFTDTFSHACQQLRLNIP